MKTRLLSPPWCDPELTEEAQEAIKLIGDEVWKDASIRFSAERDAKIKSGKSAPKGMQRYYTAVRKQASMTFHNTNEGFLFHCVYHLSKLAQQYG